MKLYTFEMIADERLKQIKEATLTDTELQSLLHVIQNGWPDHKNQLPENLKPYFALRDTLSCEVGIVLKGGTSSYSPISTKRHFAPTPCGSFRC